MTKPVTAGDGVLELIETIDNNGGRCFFFPAT